MFELQEDAREISAEEACRQAQRFRPGPRCRVIGLLEDGAASLGPQALSYVREAQCVAGSRRTLALLAPVLAPTAQRLELGESCSLLPEWVRQAQSAGRRCVVLATGDPLFFGLAHVLVTRLDVNTLELLPHFSTVQLACARLGLPWQSIQLRSIHARDAGEWQQGAGPQHGLYELMQTLGQGEQVAVLCCPENSPGRIARMLLAEGLGEAFQMAVAESLCQPGERVRAELRPAEVAKLHFAGLSLVLLSRAKAQPERGMISQQEVWAVSRARLQLRADSQVWRFGTGAGSMHPAAQGCSCSFQLGKALEDLATWPDPDAVFIGSPAGAGDQLAPLIGLSLRRLRPRGRLVMNLYTTESLATAIEALNAAGASWDVLQMQAAPAVGAKPRLHSHPTAARKGRVWILSAQAKALGPEFADKVAGALNSKLQRHSPCRL